MPAANTFKLLPLADAVKDFFTVDYTHPSALSPGKNADVCRNMLTYADVCLVTIDFTHASALSPGKSQVYLLYQVKCTNADPNAPGRNDVRPTHHI